MPSKIQVDQIAGATGSTVTLPSGQTLDLSSGTVNLPSSALSALNASNLTSGTVPSARLSLVEADIPNHSTSKLTSGTLGVARGGTGLSSLGTANQELRVNSGATALEFYTPTVASSDYVLLATTTASSSSTITFDGYFSSTYDTYIVRYYDVYHSTAAHIYVRYRRSNADVTASSYKMLLVEAYTDLTPTNVLATNRAQWNGSSLQISMGDNPPTSATTPRTQGEIMLFNPLNTATYKVIQSRSTHVRNIDLHTMHLNIGYGRLEDSTGALSGLTLYPASGNFVTGTFKLYGIK